MSLASPPLSESRSPGLNAGPKAARGKRPRVLLIVESSGAGTGRHVLDLADGLLRRDCEVHLIYTTGRIDQMFRERLAEIEGLPSMALAMRTAPTPGDVRAVKKVRRYLREFGPFDVIHGHSSKGGAIARLAALGSRARAFYTLHGLIMMDPGLALWKRAFYQGIEWALSFRTAKIIAVSPEEARAAVRVGLGAKRVAMIPNGVGPARLTPRPVARAELNVDERAIVIGFVGRLVEQKAPHILVEGFAAAVKRQPELRLAMVGNGPLMESLRELGSRLGVADKIFWLGERDARGVLAAFDVFALASRKEGLPYVVLEAMAAGLPIVATESAGVEILIDPEVNGIVTPTDNANAMTDAFVALASDRDRMARFGAASLRKAGDFTIDAMVDRTLALYLL